jgi:ribosomal protein S27AE
MYKVTVIKPFEHLNIKYEYGDKLPVEIASYGHCVEIVISKNNLNSICEVESNFFKKYFTKENKEIVEKIKECPFCGGESRIAIWGNGYIPVCKECPTMIKPLKSFKTEKDAISAWNTRDTRNKLL